MEAPLGGMMGDWEPDEGLWPLAGPGEPKPLLRDSRFSRKLQEDIRTRTRLKTTAASVRRSNLN